MPRTDDTADTALAAERIPLEAIPCIDVAPLDGGAPAQRRAVAQAMDDALRNLGFFYVINHGVAENLIAQAFSQAQRFFALPVERKAEIAIDRSPCHRGWFAVGGENLDVANQSHGDFKEGVKIGRDLSSQHLLVAAGTPLHGPNQWPRALPGWKETWVEYYDCLEQLGRLMTRGLALALDLPETYFLDSFRLPMCTAGPLHYPPQPEPVSLAQLGAGAHSDFGCMTLLAQDDTPGLQVRNSAGQWIDAPPLPGAFVVNAGDMLARWSNDRYASTLHRVINRSGRDRYSIPFFFDPDFHAEVSCLPTCQSPGEPPRYPPTTAGQYLLDRISESFTYYAGRHGEKDSPG